MYLPYDIFHHIIKQADMKLLLNLYYTNQIIRKLCLNDSFTNILLEFSQHKHFNLGATSPLLTDFLNDLTDHDAIMLKHFQLTFGGILCKNPSKQIIVLDGRSNGKSTFVCLISKLLKHKKSFFENDDMSYYKNHLVEFSEPNQPLDNEKLKRLSDEYMILITTCYLHKNFDTVVMNRLNIIRFRTKYMYRPLHENEKPIDIHMIGRLVHGNALPSLLTFLLQGCREILNHHINEYIS